MNLYENLTYKNIVHTFEKIPPNYLLTIIAIYLLINLYYLLTFDVQFVEKVKSNIHNIVILGQQIILIEDIIKEILDNEDDVSLYIKEPINSQTKLTTIQLKLLYLLNNLENLQENWQHFVDIELISNYDIRMPYAVAYHIREILFEDFVEEKEEKIWLSKQEKLCLIRYKESKTKPIEPPKTPEHLIICIKCKEALSPISS